MQNSLDMHKMHEEKIQGLAKERADTAELLTKEWQEKFLSLQQDWQEKKSELLELKKLRKNYDQMASTFSNLKNLLEKLTRLKRVNPPQKNTSIILGIDPGTRVTGYGVISLNERRVLACIDYDAFAPLFLKLHLKKYRIIFESMNKL